MAAYNALTKDDLWVDSGAGASIAVAEHHMEHAEHHIPISETPQTMSITIAKPTIDDLIEKEKKIEVIPYDHTEKARREYYGTRFEALERSKEKGKHEFKIGYLEQIPLDSMKKAKLITDVMGPASYAQDFPGVIRKYLEMLDTDGSAFIHIAVSKTSIYTERHEDVFGWLRRNIKGADVFMASPSVIQLKRNKDSIEVPDLELVMINDGQPPGRHYELPKPAKH